MINKSLNRAYKIKTFGQSMEPLLYSGDVVYIKRIKFENIRINDIICVRKKGGLFTHRVIYESQKYLITRGDNNDLSDGKIYPKNIIGVVKKVKRDKQIFDILDLYLFQSTLYFKEIVRVKKALEKVKIDYVILKGLPLHLFYEGSHPKRLYADCDILVRITNHESRIMNKALSKLGYKVYDTSYSKIQKKLKKGETEISFYKIVNGAVISFDIHLEAVFLMTQIANLNSLYPRSLVESFTEKLIRERREVVINCEQFPILSAENLFIYLVLHLYHHNFVGTYRYDLIAKIIRREKLNYNEIAKTISEYKLNNFTYPVFLLLEKYYGVKFEDAFFAKIKPPSKVLKTLNSQLSSLNIFNGESRVSSGVRRFNLLFSLSPHSLIRKSTILLNPEVIYFALWYGIKRIQSIFPFFT